MSFHFTTIRNPIEAQSGYLDLGPGHSQIIAPYLMINEIDRLEPAIVYDPTSLSVAAWKANSDTSDRIMLCANELRKFCPTVPMRSPIRS